MSSASALRVRRAELDPVPPMADPPARFRAIRARSLALCRPLTLEDHQPQPFADASPPKWHLGHTTWFFERLILAPHAPVARPLGPDYGYVFNSYYEALGPRVARAARGGLSRPTLSEVVDYRAAVDEAMLGLIDGGLDPALAGLVELGLQHEQQHQELLVTDLKAVLGLQPLEPAYDLQGCGVLRQADEHAPQPPGAERWLALPEGTVWIGHDGEGFAFDNESRRHRQWLCGGSLRATLVTQGEWLAFMADGGYRRPELWHSDGWDWIRREGIRAPMYWAPAGGDTAHWTHYTLSGRRALEPAAPVCHVSWYEASAWCAWAGLRLPTEAEREALAPELGAGERWEWSGSAYRPYPGFRIAPGAVGEYNGKFMTGQQVLRGASFATPPGHARPTYRNFFAPTARWQYTGVRPARDGI